MEVTKKRGSPPFTKNVSVTLNNRNLINRAKSVCMGESRPQSVLKASIEILPYRHPAGLIGAGYDARNILL